MRTLVNRYSSFSSSVAAAKGPLLMLLSISAQLSLCDKVIILLINPSSPSSASAARSFCCWRHHAVLSGILAGITVPKMRVKASASSPVGFCLPYACRF